MTSFSLNFFSDQIQCIHVFLILQFPEPSNLKHSYFLQTKREISLAYQSSQKIFRVRRPFFNPPWFSCMTTSSSRGYTCDFSCSRWQCYFKKLSRCRSISIFVCSKSSNATTCRKIKNPEYSGNFSIGKFSAGTSCSQIAIFFVP